MTESKNQIVVYQPNETVRLEAAMAIGNIGIGNTSTLATLNDDLGRKCFAFMKLDTGEIRGAKSSAFSIDEKKRVNNG